MVGFFTLHGRPSENSQYKGIVECALPGQHSFIFEAFRQSVSAGARVLDLASGMGAWAARLTDHGYDVVACDLYPERCKVPCQEVDLDDEFSHAFGAEPFDAITAIEMLEHVENPRHTLRESNKILRQGGSLVLSTPNASGLHSRVKFLFTGRFAQFDDEQYRNIGHIRPLTFWELEKMLTESGFKIEKVLFYNHFDSIPRTAGEIVKMVSSVLVKPFIGGIAGGQAIVIVAQKTQ
jgi:2-polyprenyl-3-methyl-5-hydroxy-6-metoxy-1,4-benzoquinol methylase